MNLRKININYRDKNKQNGDDGLFHVLRLIKVIISVCSR